MILGELLKAETALLTISTQDVSVKVAYHLAKLTQLVQVETKYYYDQRKKLIEELGIERDVTILEKEQGMFGKIFEVKPENFEIFGKKINELLELPIIIDKWLLTLKILEEFKISSKSILALDPLITKEAE